MFLLLLLPVAFVFADLMYKAGITPLDFEVSPPKPRWPAEWSAEITIKNHTTNSTKHFNIFYSQANNGSLTYYPSADYLFLNGYKYTIYKNGTCNFIKTDEQLDVPKVYEFNFAGIVKFNEERLWWWENGNYTYITRQTDYQEPVIAIDKLGNESIIWHNFTHINSWPLSIWRHPSNCTVECLN